LVWKCCRDHVGFSFFLCRDRSQLIGVKNGVINHAG
jgi:hypothetical protein